MDRYGGYRNRGVRDWRIFGMMGRDGVCLVLPSVRIAKPVWQKLGRRKRYVWFLWGQRDVANSADAAEETMGAELQR